MTKDEAMKLALEKIADALPAYIDGVASRDYLATIHKALTEQSAQQEPVGALILGGVIDTSDGPEYEEWDIEWNHKAIEALQYRLVTSDPVTLNIYTTPPAQRKPLTDDEIRSIWSNGDCFEEVAFARAIEAAHGIKENT